MTASLSSPHTRHRPRAALSALGLLALLASASGKAEPAAPAVAVPAWEMARAAADFDRGYFTRPGNEFAAAVRRAGNLSGRTDGSGDTRASGWVEYDFTVPAGGWHELFVEPSGSGHEVILDGRVLAKRWPVTKQENLWLTEGRHTLRIQRLHWTGLGAVTGWRLRAVENADPLRGFSVDMDGDRTLLRAGEPVVVDVWGGALPGQTNAFELELQLQGKGDQVVARAKTGLAGGDMPRTVRLALPCPEQGEYSLRAVVNGRLLTPPEWVAPRFLALDVSPRLATGRELRKELLAEIDCALTAPEYVGGGETRVVEKAFGAYRESGELGWLQFMDETHPGWFAYAFTVPEAQQPYWFEVDYPDDARRTFCLAVRESTPGAYPTTAGADTGGEFALSQAMQTQGILHWARGQELRLLCITPQTGSRAAAARIRLYRLPDGLPQRRVPSAGGRGFGNWYEEGGSLMGIYAAPDGSLAGSAVAADRWAQSIAYMGGDTLIYTMAVYQFGLYPSAYNVSFNTLFSPDVVGTIVLACEKYGLKFFGEFHPEARELDWPAPGWDGRGAAGAEWPDNRAYARDGRSGRSTRHAAFSPLHPRNREWYAGMIEEFVQRYKDSPAFKGVSLRLMGWVNPGLNNFDSAEWGYDDCTVALFARETGRIPEASADAPERFRQRYDWLKAHAWDEWLDWRCAKITELHRDLAGRVRAARADLQVVIHGGLPDLRGAGIDPAALAEIPGVVLLGGGAYGRRGSLPDIQRQRDSLIDPVRLKRLCPPGSPGRFLFGAGYFEATGVVVPPEALGFDPRTKRTWMSGVVNPAGRNYLERYALALAEADAQFLGDGGNAYTLGQPPLREFLAEYRALPPRPFTAREDARDPVAAWERREDRDLYFYLVNRESYPIDVEVRMEGDGQLARLATGEPVSLIDGVLKLTLPAFGLCAYSASPSLGLVKVTALPPAGEREKALRVSQWLTAAATVVDQRADVEPAGKQALREAADKAAQAMDAGHLWRVKTLCQAEPLQAIFQKTLAYPPLPFPRPELWRMAAGANIRWAKEYPQADLSQPDTLAASLGAGGAPGATAVVPGQETLGPLASWIGADAVMSLGFNASVPQRFRLWARLAVGEGCAGLAVRCGDDVLPLGPRQAPEPGTGLVVRTAEIALAPGADRVELRSTGNGRVYLDQVYLEPLFSSIAPMAFAAYFPNAGQSHWEKPLPPEEPAGAAAAAVFAGTDGREPKEVRWESYPAEALAMNHNVGVNNAWGSVRCPPGPLGKEVVAYCRAIVKAPSARAATISFGGTSQIRLFVNGDLIADSVADQLDLRWWRGPNHRQIELKAGDNVLLVKLGNAGESHPESYRLVNFHAAITDPGDLTFSDGR